MDKLSPNDSVFNTVIDQFKSTVKDSDSSLIKKGLTEEFKTKGDYEGREIYELLQNAEDQGSEYVIITLDEQYLSVENGGSKCVPFSRKGFISIMMADMSPKFEDGTKRYIGCKGLGFRSILNWSKSIEICSNGVRCEFSRDIADGWWEDIKCSIRKNISDINKANSVINEHEAFAKKHYKFNTPVPTLARPNVHKYDGPQNSTTVRVEYNQDSGVIKSIKEQLESLSGVILLFLTNIKRIEIIDSKFGLSKTVETKAISYTNPDESVKKHDILTSAPEKTQSFKSYYLLSRSDVMDDYRYEVSVAYCPESKESGNYVYSFFPTKMRWDWPCVVHATFDLNSSRNALMDNSKENDKLMEILADVIMEFSMWLAKEKASKGLYDWDASSLLLFNNTNRGDYPILSEQINKRFCELCVIPVVGNQYKLWVETEYYGKKFSEMFERMCRSFPNVSHLFGNHIKPLIPKAIEEYHSESVCDESFVSRVNALSEDMLQWGEKENEYRILLISALLEKNYGSKFTLLVASDVHQLCEKPCLYVGRTLPNPPEELKNTYIDSSLLDLIYKLVGSTDAETVIKKISPITDIYRSDISHLKKEIIRFSENNTNIDEFKKLIRAFYIGSSNENDNENIANVVKEISTQLKLFDASGTQKRYPYEMVVRDDTNNGTFADYQDAWVLYLSINQWADYIEADVEKVRKFFIETLGISNLVPMDYIPFGDDDPEYLKEFSAQYEKNVPAYCFGSSRLIEYQSRPFANYAFVVKPDFLDFLSNKGINCNDILHIVLSDQACRNSIRNKMIYYQYRSRHEEPVSCSYLEYKLRNHSSLRPIQLFIISDNLCLQSEGSYSFETLQPYYSEQETKQILLNLGAKASFAEFSKDELYGILRSVPDICDSKGVSTIYKKIREALLPYRSDCEKEAREFYETGTLYARYQGCVRKFAANEVYYWDNDQLPQKVLSTKPKLEIGNRVGEESVRDLFGISLAKDILIEEVKDESCPNELLTTQVNTHFKRRIKYLLSYCYKGQNRFKEDYVEPLKDVQFRIFSSYKYILDNNIEELKEGEMLTSQGRNRVFNICSTVDSISDSLDNPELCEAIVESICITLKITGSEFVGAFRDIISNTISKNEYLWKKDIDLDTWVLIEKTMGISEKEKQFWTIVANQTQKQINLSLLSVGYREKMDYLKSVFPEVEFESIFEKRFSEFDDLDIDKKYSLVMGLSKFGFRDMSMIDEEDLKQFYADKLYEIKNTYGKAFETFHYRNLIAKQQMSIEEVYAFSDECRRFLEDHSWTDSLANNNCNSLLSYQQLENLVSKHMKQLGIDSVDDVDDINPCTEYHNIMSEAGLIESDFVQRDLILSYFDGFEKEFKEIADTIVRQRNADTMSANSDDSRTAEASSFSYGYWVPMEPNTQKARHLSNDGGSYNSRPANLYKNGKNAEWLVYNALCARKDEFPKVIPNSRILNSVIGSDNNGKHCDILYYKKSKPNEERYLEVKSLKGSAIFLSDNEYLFASKHKETYDIAVVKDNSVTIIEHPFMEAEDKPSLRVKPDIYRIDFTIKKEQ